MTALLDNWTTNLSSSQYNVPKEVWQPGSINHEPLVEVEDGLHGYAFLSAEGKLLLTD